MLCDAILRTILNNSYSGALQQKRQDSIVMGKNNKSSDRKFSALISRFIPDSFILMMAAAVLLGFLWPQGGLSDGPLQLGLVTSVGIALVFFLHGANLDSSALLSGLKQWRVHGVVQATTFIFFPLLCIAIYYLSAPVLDEKLRIGLFFIGAVPSTIASSVAMTALAKGNIPVAVFNASVSGLFGMLATPIIMTWIGTNHIEFSLIDAFYGIALQLLLPFILGQISRPLTANFIKRHKGWIGKIDRIVIALIVFGSFAKATADQAWSNISLSDIIIVIFLVGAILGCALLFTTKISNIMGLNQADEAAVVFCGSKKSLAAGAPMAQILFAGNPALSMIVLPLMVYHQLQLMVCAILAKGYANKAAAKELELTQIPSENPPAVALEVKRK